VFRIQIQSDQWIWIRIRILDSGFDSDSGFGFRIRIPDSDSGFGFQIQIPDSDSRFGFQIRIPDSDSRFGFRIRIPDQDSGSGSRRANMIHKNRKIKNFMFRSAGCSVKSPNAVWGLYVVIGNTNILFGPAQFICKALCFFQKRSLHDIIFCFGYLYCRF
jgi:hypothetical protein